MTFRVHKDARAEAVESADYYERQQAGLGAQFTDVVEVHLAKIKHTPQRFAKLETTRLKADIRRCLLPRFPYLIIYEIVDDHIHVLAVAHASRRPDYWIKRRATDD